MQKSLQTLAIHTCVIQFRKTDHIPFKVHLHWAKANCLFLCLSLLNVNIKLDSLWTHLEVMWHSNQYKLTPATSKFNAERLRLKYTRNLHSINWWYSRIICLNKTMCFITVDLSCRLHKPQFDRTVPHPIHGVIYLSCFERSCPSHL